MKTGYHAVYENDFFDAIDHAKLYGFDFVQFDLGIPRFFLDDLSEKDLLCIRNYAKEKEIEITFHAPGDNVSLFCDYPFIREGIIKQFQLIMHKASILEARHVTIHAGSYPMFKKSGTKYDDYTKEYKDYYENVLYENLKEIIKCSKNTMICLENYNFNSIIVEVIEKLIKNGFSIYLTLDTAKLYMKNLQMNNEIFNFYLNYKTFIRELHIHDKNETYGSHQMVGTGYIDFTKFLDFIRNEDTYINFEIRPIESAADAKRALEQILHISMV